ANLESGLDQGGSFAVFYHGEPVVNLWGGYSDYDCRRIGLLDYQKPVSRYWPEFAQKGKGAVTVEQLISNQEACRTRAVLEARHRTLHWPSQISLPPSNKGGVSKTSRPIRDAKKMNDPDIRELPCPSTHGHATAANMAKLFGIVANGGTKPNHIFGHGGYGGQYAACDIRHKIGFAYTTCFLDPFTSYSDNGDERMYSLVNVMYQCVFDKENMKQEWRLFPFHSKFKSYMDQNQMTSKL
ncbi:hypothetical protein MAR_008557, partial [Mya arenaria]